MNYASLHTHSHFSNMDGVATPTEYAARAAQIGMPAIAITDHGTLSGHREWVRAMKDRGVKPILGIEAYYCADRFDRRDYSERNEPLDLVYNHLTVLAKDSEGLKNLNRLNEVAWTEGFFRKPRIDWEVLDEFGDGLIISTACMSGVINKAIEVGDLAVAKAQAVKFAKRFGDNFYIEVMPHNVAGMNNQLLELADSMGIPVIVTPDCHHADKSQKEIQEMMLLLNTHSKVKKDSTFAGSLKYDNMMERLDYLYGADRRMSFRDFDIHLMSYDEMRAAMLKEGITRTDIYENTLRIAESVQDYDIPVGLDLLPTDYADPDKYLRGLAIKGLKDKGLTTDEYKTRLDYELGIIKEKKFSSYFLIARAITSYARQHGILMSPGRGSSAGSLAMFALGVTDIDPIRYNLLFERFLNPDRNDFPDCDMDFMDTRREEIKQFMIKKYGHVASIATFMTFGDKTTVRDIARVLNIPLSDVNAVLKHISTWEDYCSSSATKSFREKYPEIQQYGELLLGRIRGTGLHAAGVVASRIPINEVAPIETRKNTQSDDRIPVVALDKDETENVGLIKFDILGLKTLTVVDDTLRLIKQRHGIDIDLNSIDFGDRSVWEMLNAGLTAGVFQAEAGPYTKLIRDMGVWTFDELVASNALVRPGAANTIGKDYIARKKGKQPIKYPHKSMQPYLTDTYGCIIYQEQVMQACVTLGGMSMSEADKVRKIIGKKKDASEFDVFRTKFVENASNIIPRPVAEKLWHDFEAHSGYSFNKSHAVAYSTLSYWTAWLKRHYTLEFFQALMTSSSNDRKVITQYFAEAKRMGVKIKFPHVNVSDINFKIEGDGIRIGLANIKYISDVSAQRFIDERPFNSYAELESFVKSKGTGVNSKSLESMRLIGAANFEDMKVEPEIQFENAYEILGIPAFAHNLPGYWDAKITAADDYDEGMTAVMMGLVRDVKIGTGWSLYEVVDSTGVFKFFGRPHVSVEVGKSYLFVIGDKSIISAVETTKLDGTTAIEKYLSESTESGFVVAAASRETKAGKKMGTVVVDIDGKLESLTLFPGNFAQVAPKIKPGQVYNFDYGYMRDGGMVINGIR